MALPGERISPKRDNMMRTSLSETEGLAWARVLGLNEFMRIVHVLCVLVRVIWLLYPRCRKYMHVVCVWA